VSHRNEQSAVFWRRLLNLLVDGTNPPEDDARLLCELAQTEQLFPNGRRRGSPGNDGDQSAEGIRQRSWLAIEYDLTVAFT
jgi:hypothetical protein